MGTTLQTIYSKPGRTRLKNISEGTIGHEILAWAFSKYQAFELQLWKEIEDASQRSIKSHIQYDQVMKLIQDSSVL